MKKMMLSIFFVIVISHISFAKNNYENLIDSLAGSKKEAVDAYYELLHQKNEVIPVLSAHIYDNRETKIEYTDLGITIIYMHGSKHPKKTVGDWCYDILINMIDRHDADPPKFSGYLHNRYNKFLLLEFIEKNKYKSLSELRLKVAKEADAYYKSYLEVYQKRIDALESK